MLGEKIVHQPGPLDFYRQSVSLEAIQILAKNALVKSKAQGTEEPLTAEILSQPTDLEELEKLLTIVLFTASQKDNPKHKGARRVLRRTKEIPVVQPSVLARKPQIEEEEYNHDEFVVTTAEIAVVKASTPLMGEVIDERARHAVLHIEQVVDEATKTGNGKGIEVNKKGERLFCVAGDTMVYVLKENSDRRALYQCPELKTKDDHYANLCSLLRITAETNNLGGNLKIAIEDTQAVHDPIHDVGVLFSRHRTISYKNIPQEVIYGFVYGVQENVSPMVRDAMVQIWEASGFSLRETLFRGWTPEDGISPESLSKVNGGFLNQCPFFTPFIESIGNVRRENVDEFSQEVFLMRQIVTGFPTHLNHLIRSLLRYTQDEEFVHAVTNVKRTEYFQQFAKSFNQKYSAHSESSVAVCENWYDLSESISQFSETDEVYIEWLLTRFVLEQSVNTVLE
ncbi:MAG TPA: hypothetical protein VLH19_05570 [Patescibacteria group bacterium]|nr:hypothetical protein [Patescibacteria group bacterium]